MFVCAAQAFERCCPLPDTEAPRTETGPCSLRTTKPGPQASGGTHTDSSHPPQVKPNQKDFTRMLLRLTSSSFGSLFFIRSRVPSTSVEFGSSSGTGLYCVGLITPRGTGRREGAHRSTATLSLHRILWKEAAAGFRHKRRPCIRGCQERRGEGLTGPCLDSVFAVLCVLGE